MALTTPEVLNIVGKLLVSISEKLQDEETPGELSTAEIFDIIQQVLLDLLNEFQD